MKRFIMLVLTFFLAAGIACAEDRSDFWDNLFKKVNSIASRSNSHRTYTSVMGIRGAEDVDDDSLYWKGEAGQAVAEEIFVSETESDMFIKAVSLAAEGEHEIAMEGFELFVANYPDSPLTADARAAIQNLGIPPAAPEAGAVSDMDTEAPPSDGSSDISYDRQE